MSGELEFPFGIEPTEEGMSLVVGEADGSSKAKEGKKRKNKVQEVDPDSEDRSLLRT